MKAFKSLFAVAICSLLLAACAKKDNNYANKIKNAMGATARNNEAAAAAKASGILFDVVGLNSDRDNDNSNGLFGFKASLMIDNQIKTVAFTLSGMQPMPAGTDTFNGYNIRFEAVCLTNICNPLVVMATTFKNNQRYAQVGYKFFRKNQTADQDIYQLFDATTAMPDLNSMVNELNRTPQ